MTAGQDTPPGPDEETVCRVCGYEGELFWEGGWPTEAICPCCGNESDMSDTSVTGIRTYRGYWTGHGARWDSPSRRPKEWNLLDQLSRIPPEWR
ncbi:hypothetical protein [Streptomyces peucetius]|uniref:Uncharacterized protein n=1 Tax=Streptomyces peucetius TaxID=1950 RepID=A0ABY6IHZ0_STRPE|nr:hypothetical protein [Streptomyces peucetius]UYQ65320.1 hypothetical protein OGH68_30210 [Streptomyces peucetius]